MVSPWPSVFPGTTTPSSCWNKDVPVLCFQLEEVMETETYKNAKLILERFDPEAKRKAVSAPVCLCFFFFLFYLLLLFCLLDFLLTCCRSWSRPRCVLRWLPGQVKVQINTQIKHVSYINPCAEIWAMKSDCFLLTSTFSLKDGWVQLNECVSSIQRSGREACQWGPCRRAAPPWPWLQWDLGPRWVPWALL